MLSSLFAIDVFAYAVMSNPYHLVLKVCPEQLIDLSEDEIMDRWCALFKGPLLIQNYRNGEDLKPFIPGDSIESSRSSIRGSFPAMILLK